MQIVKQTKELFYQQAVYKIPTYEKINGVKFIGIFMYTYVFNTIYLKNQEQIVHAMPYHISYSLHQF